ncbi:hypothetical protein GC106_17350 [Kibdelosporangium sp. 4NS15]|uniref:WXG100 family type VII secretion target n=1 Tax=Kibdelosporangium persicum TaxID=2698649 RepID=A0ABX2F051_9PSEU|nr:hypothetical protein [Kibdelosporangium persicum]NRN64529.1 hypothetical protein [Kibdelosporangium persicum]
MALRGVQDSADDLLKPPEVDQTTARKMIDDAIARWNKELSSGSGNGELYKRWQHHPVSGNRFMKEPCWGDHKDQPEGELLEKLKAIEFGPILETARRLTDSATFTGDVQEALKNVSARVADNWQDNNGQTAVDKINALATASTKFQDTANRFATNLAGFANESRKCIQRLVDFAGRESDQYFNYLGDDNHVDIDHFAEAIDEIDESLQKGHTDGPIWQQVPYNLEIARSNTPGLIIWQNFETWYSDVEKGRLDTFCENYTNAVGTFRKLIRECHDTIDRHLQNLMDSSAGLGFTPFANLDELAKGGGDQPKDPPPKEEPPKEKEPPPAEKKNGGGGPVDSGGPPPGSGGPPPGSTPPPPPPPPPPSTDDPKAVDPNAPGTTDPSDVPGAPVDGGPGTNTGGETVTIEDGGKKISVTSPDSEGHVKVTVDDGTGQPKTYDMDFSQPTGQQPGIGTPGAGTPGAPGTSTPGQQEPVQFGPDGQPVQTMPAPAGGDPAAETLTPGPDGKIVLEDGNVTITAEHPPGQPDVVLLTVDDGTGDPTTYTLDYSDPANPQVDQPEPAAARQDVQAERQVAQAQGFAGPLGADARPDFAGAVASATPGVAEAPFGGTPNGMPPEALAGSDQPVQTTSTQAVGGDFGGGSGDGGFSDSSWSTQGDLLSGGDDDYNQVAPAAGEAGLAAIPEGGQQANPNQAGGAGMGGMPMMGGMGGGGAGGGDSERSGGQWSVTGDLFADDDLSEPARIAGVLDEDVR